MGYISGNLLEGEEVLQFTRPHLVIFARSFFWMLVALVLFIFKQSEQLLFFGKVNSMFIIAVLILAGWELLSATISYYNSEYVLTNRRILVKLGFIRVRSLEIFLDRIEGVYVEQSITGRLFNFGTVIIAGVGGTKNPFWYIPNPLKFRSQLQSHLPKRG